MGKGYRVKVNGVYEDGEQGCFGWEEIGFPIMSPTCIGNCNRPVKEFDEGYITAYDHFICIDCISEFEDKDAS